MAGEINLLYDLTKIFPAINKKTNANDVKATDSLRLKVKRAMTYVYRIGFNILLY